MNARERQAYEEGLSDEEIMLLSQEHSNGNHIDVFELRKNNTLS